jgi:hypothetical protein
MAQSENRKTDPHAGELIDTLVSECRDPARLLELYYWSTEPELLPIVRAFAAFPNETRKRIETFLRTTQPKSVSAEIGADGQIRLLPGDYKVVRTPSKAAA